MEQFKQTEANHKMPCPMCGNQLDGHAAAQPAPDTPAPGALSLCAYCGYAMIFNDDMNLREPTFHESVDIEADQNISYIRKVLKEMNKRRLENSRPK